jgi:uncharacterized protein (DUF488 family)
MIYTIGYETIHRKGGGVNDLVKLMNQNDITLLVDVRSKPRSHWKAFNRPVLEWALKERYLWDGERLGGLQNARGMFYYEALETLARRGSAENVLVMCMEANPDKCHRKKWIAADLKAKYGIEVRHL